MISPLLRQLVAAAAFGVAATSRSPALSRRFKGRRLIKPRLRQLSQQAGRQRYSAVGLATAEYAASGRPLCGRITALWAVMATGRRWRPSRAAVRTHRTSGTKFRSSGEPSADLGDTNFVSPMCGEFTAGEHFVFSGV